MQSDLGILTLICEKWKEARKRGENPSAEQLCSANPELLERVREAIRNLAAIEKFEEPQNLNKIEAHPTSNDADPTGSYEVEKADPTAENTSEPLYIGRYRAEKILGRGGFGIVYRARDGLLRRFVAIKVPHKKRIADAQAAEAYLREARTVANLVHSNIVPVFDVGSTEDYPCFIVSMFIEGSTLARKIKEDRPGYRESVDLVATIAEALHYAHTQGLVHRDIKPSNLLIDKSGKPFVADFGLALRDQDAGKGPHYAGTPAYMSPEQAHGEGHRVDGRSDIFSLGVVFYELLTGRHPFKGDTEAELLEHITDYEPRPPRQVDDAIPKELERICLKALAKRATDRYTTAKDMAEDLRLACEGGMASGERALGESERLHEGQPAKPAGIPTNLVASQTPPTSSRADNTPPTPQHHPPSTTNFNIVPKGLRSFDYHDADFFLELLPGPRDRDGLPDSIRFWKSRIEEKDPDNTFSVGLIYGPSGCGKSSMVKAGLLPRLAAHVLAVYVEATAEETESRLLKGLRKRCPLAADNSSLKDTLADLRRGQSIPTGKKVVIVIDQFEQWLHAKKEEKNTELVQALRQCDGGRVQCIVMVRDDFWMAATRFMRELEVRLVEGQNSAVVDLFDADHARKVLAAFGRALGKLPENSRLMSKDQKEFLNQAVAGLLQEGKVISVRLALFAEMMKSKVWTPSSLKAMGGTEGVGAAFLDETFSAKTAPPEHRYHQKAARAVLKALLPELGADIKGHMRSHAELMEVSALGARPIEFEDLVRILDGEIRLITPTDPEGKEEGGTKGDKPKSAPETSVRYYQLTHDYLVHSLRDWLTQKQRETRRGRAELRLEECAALWNDKPESRFLTPLLDWAYIRLFTKSRGWNPRQRSMMRWADRFYAVRFLAVLGLLISSVWGAEQYLGQKEARALRAQLISADVSEVPRILKAMEPHRNRVVPLLSRALAGENDPKVSLKLSLGLVAWDPGQVDFLFEQLLQSAPGDFAVIRLLLEPYKEVLIDRLWNEFVDQNRDRDWRFRAACTLIDYAPEDRRLGECTSFIAGGLVSESPLTWNHWKEALKPVRERLLPALAESLEDGKWIAAERRAIIDFYRDFAGDSASALMPLEERLRMDRPEMSSQDLARRKATIAAALAALRKPEAVWPLLIHTPNPTLRSYLIERLGTSGVDPQLLKKRLESEANTSARRALILSLGAFRLDQLPGLDLYLSELYENDPDPGIHGAAGWVLRTCWERKEQVGKIDLKFATGKPVGNRMWFVNQRQPTDRFTITFSVIEVPSSSLFPEAPKEVSAAVHRFAISTTELTVEQFRAFEQDLRADAKWRATPDLPINDVSWYKAAEFCNRFSDHEKIDKKDWCFSQDNGKWDVVPGFRQRSGYRLPTEQEWKIACQAGANTGWHFGEADEELTGKYAWWKQNAFKDGSDRVFPVGLLKPNDWGLFDMHGNLSEWCLDSIRPQTGSFQNDVESGVRGGSFGSNYLDLSSASRGFMGRQLSIPNLGFRIIKGFQ